MFYRAYCSIASIRSLEYAYIASRNLYFIYGETMIEYLSIKQTPEKWGITIRRIQVPCTEGRVHGTIKIDSYWAISTDAEKPDDKRSRSGKHIKK